MMNVIPEKDRNEIINVCSMLVSDEIGFIAGCRKLVSLINKLNLRDESCFFPFIGVVSETDDYPDDNIRNNYSGKYLDTIDAEVSEYVSKVRPSIVEACIAVIKNYE